MIEMRRLMKSDILHFSKFIATDISLINYKEVLDEAEYVLIKKTMFNWSGKAFCKDYFYIITNIPIPFLRCTGIRPIIPTTSFSMEVILENDSLRVDLKKVLFGPVSGEVRHSEKALREWGWMDYCKVMEDGLRKLDYYD